MPLARANAKKLYGDTQLQVTRSVPGRILSQGLAKTLDGYFAGSLQRKATIQVEASVSDEVEVLGAKGILIEALPDSSYPVPRAALGCGAGKSSLARTSRALLDELGLAGAELKKTTPLTFACRCSPDRAVAMLAALSEDERKDLPETIDITCHMCGRTFTVKTR